MSMQARAYSVTFRTKRDGAWTPNLSVALEAAGRETRGFSIMVRDLFAPLVNCDLAVTALTGDAGTIPASAIWTYRAHQLEVIQETHHTVTPSDGTGWYPSPLIPDRHPITGAALPAATYTAFPFTVPANQQHTLYVEVRVPHGQAPGVYTGTATVSADGETDVVLNVSMTVVNFSLPVTPAILVDVDQTARRMEKYSPWDHTEEELQDIRDVANTIKVNSRLPAADTHTFRWMPEGSGLDWEIPAADITAMRDHIDAYPSSMQKIIHPQWTAEEPHGSPETGYYAAWVTAIEDAVLELDRPGTQMFIHMDDEPSTPAMSDWTALWGTAIRASSLVGSLVQHSWVQSGTENVEDIRLGTDIWSIQMKEYEDASVDAILARGETALIYSALSDAGNLTKRPWFQLDFAVFHYRVVSWLAFAGSMMGWTYWGGAIFCWGLYDSGTDPWTESATIGRATASGTIRLTEGSTTVTGVGTLFTTQLDQYVITHDVPLFGRVYRIDSIVDDTTLILETPHVGETMSGLTFNRWIYNHDGIIWIPATVETVGYNGIVETLASKAAAAGAADFDILMLAEKYGFGTEAHALVDALVTPIDAWNSNLSLYDPVLSTLRALIATVRASITLTPLFQRDYAIGDNVGFRLQIAASAGAGIDQNIFRHYQKPLNAAGETNSTFSGVCSYPDMLELPIDAPESTTSPAAFRTDTMDIVVDSVSIAKDIWTLTKTQVDELLETIVAIEILESSPPYAAEAE